MDNNRESQVLLALGGHVMGDKNPLNPWTWRARFTGYWGQSNYKGFTGANLDMAETADFDTFGISSALAGGYQFRAGGHILMPEAGLNYMGSHRQGFTTQTESNAWNVSCQSLETHQLTARASMRWTTQIQVAGISLNPSLATGIGYLLFNDGIDIYQSVPGTPPVSFTTSQDRLTGNLDLSVLFNARKKVSFELAYSGGLSDHTISHGVWSRFKWVL